MSHRRRLAGSLLLRLTASVAIALTAVAVASSAGAQPPAKQWPSGGQNISDTHANPFETQISPADVGSLGVKWTYATTGDVSATPAVVKGVVYFPDWGGDLNAVNASTGALLWSKPISDYDGISGAKSRTSPAVAGGVIYIGDQNGAHVMAVKASTGALLWIEQLSTHASAIITQSPLVYKGVVYVGVSSSEQYAAMSSGYACCTFRGSMVALKAKTGKVLWQTYMVPPNDNTPGGYSGGAVWSSTPALDPATHTLYITTGNNYSIPTSASTCESSGGTVAQCLAPDDYIDAIVSLNAKTGAVNWADGEGGFDTWTEGCTQKTITNCPIPGPDADFGSGAQLLTITNGKKKERVVGAGEKSGTYWEVDATTGHVLWGTPVGPGGSAGGMQWGAATDGTRIYVAEADS
ncbi:MAG: PQQ-binding-like beta-propeller repeat protein, partial [Acidimicrobiales bacterium]